MAFVPSESINLFSDFKIGKLKCDYLLFEMKNASIEVSQQGNCGADWDNFVEILKSHGCCWAAYHFSFKTSAGERSKLILVRWVPTLTSAKDKMKYAMWSGVIKAALPGIQHIIQACDLAELHKTEILSKVSRFERDAVVSEL